eukprot:1677484-Pyramimonas_sp.AAC.1
MPRERTGRALACPRPRALARGILAECSPQHAILRCVRRPPRGRRARRDVSWHELRGRRSL